MPQFEFSPPNEEELTNELARDRKETESQGGADTIYLKQGITQLRVLPPHPNSNGRFFRRIFEHNLLLPDGTKKLITAPEPGDYNPILEVAETLQKSGNLEAAKRLRPTERYLINAIVQSAPQGVEYVPGKVYVVKVPKSVKRDLLQLDQDIQSGFADITGVYSATKGEGLQGISIRITRTGSGLSTRYQTMPTALRTDLAADLAAIGIDINDLQLYDLYNLFPAPSTEELKDLAAQLTNPTSPSATPVPVPNVQVAPGANAPIIPRVTVPQPTPQPTAAPPVTLTPTVTAPVVPVPPSSDGTSS